MATTKSAQSAQSDDSSDLDAVNRKAADAGVAATRTSNGGPVQGRRLADAGADTSS